MIVVKEFFSIPDDFSLVELATRLKRVLVYLLEIELHTEVNRLKINEMIELLSDVRSARVPARSRSDLHNHLKSSPFLTTLLQLEEPSDGELDDTAINRKYAFLTHQYSVRGLSDYDAYLAFFHAFIDDAPELLTLYQLLHLTTIELRHRLEAVHSKTPQLISFLRYLSPSKPQKQHKETSIFTAENHHVIEIDKEFDYIENSDADGNYLTCLIRAQPYMSLTKEQQRRRFKFKMAGVQRAIYNKEAATPLNIGAALPIEINEFLQNVAPSLLQKNKEQFPPVFDDIPYLLVFLFRLIGVQQPWALKLVNLDTKNFNKDFNDIKNQIHYKLDKKSLFVNATLVLNAEIINTLSPENINNENVYYVANKFLTFVIPKNILELLNIVLRGEREASRRHNVTIEQVTKISEKNYRKWLREKIRETELWIRGISVSALERAFLQYARITVPETHFAFLSQKAVIQNHYVSAGEHEISTKILRAWRDFCSKTGIRWGLIDAVETSQEPVSKPTHNEVGSKITLRNIVLPALYESLLASNTLNEVAFYVYIRIATTSALRPVTEPFPLIADANLKEGIMTVADKRAHSADERRLVVLTKTACRMLSAWLETATSIAPTLLLPPPSHLLMLCDEGRWNHFSPKFVNKLLFERTGEQLSGHSFRHVAAKRFIESSEEFDQLLLNFLMNHYRAGFSVLHRFASIAPVQIASILRRKMTTYDSEFETFDERAIEILNMVKGLK